MNKIWIEAARPKTLAAAIAPVLIGTAMAYGDGAGNFLWFLLSLLFALLIQIGTNFTNDYYDFVKGADDEKRLGPRRVTAAGLVLPDTMFTATIIVFAAAACFALPMGFRGGLVMPLVVFLSIASGWAYTGGPFPLGYNGLGELFVLLFFGPIAVGSTYYLQALHLPWEVLFIGLAPGLISTAIIVVNNLRDVEGDTRSGKRTLAVRFGRDFAKREYVLCLLLAAFVPPLVAYFSEGSAFSLLTLLILPFAFPVAREVLTKRDGPSLNDALAETGKLLIAFTVAFSLGRFL